MDKQQCQQHQVLLPQLLLAQHQVCIIVLYSNTALMIYCMSIDKLKDCVTLII